MREAYNPGYGRGIIALNVLILIYRMDDRSTDAMKAGALGVGVQDASTDNLISIAIV
ncbi:hypothetical protein LLG46_12875 [bacterium]|nr:hypothetical protein [bacterium]